jgi:integrase
MQHGEVFKRPGRKTWSARWYDANGVRQTKGGWRTRAEAARFLNEQVDKVRLGIHYRPDRTFDDLAEAYEKQYTAASKDSLKYAMKKARSAFGEVRLTHLTAEHVGALRASIEGPHASFRTIAMVKQVLAAGGEWRWLDVNPAAKVKNPAPHPPEIEPFHSCAEIDAIAAELGTFSEIQALAAGTGLRPEEWSALQKRDIDLSERVLYVRRVWVNGEEKPLLKTSRSRRRVPLRLRVVTALEQLAADLREPTDALLPGIKGKYSPYGSGGKTTSIRPSGLLVCCSPTA